MSVGRLLHISVHEKTSVMVNFDSTVQFCGYLLNDTVQFSTKQHLKMPAMTKLIDIVATINGILALIDTPQRELWYFGSQFERFQEFGVSATI